MNDHILQKGVVHKYGGTSVVTSNQDNDILTRIVDAKRRVSSNGYTILVTSGIGKLNDTSKGRKATDLMYDVINGIHRDQAWQIVKERYQSKLQSHGIDQELLLQEIQNLEGRLSSGDIIPKDAPYFLGFPEQAQAKILQALGNHLYGDISWHLPLFSSMVGQSGFVRTDVPIDHENTLLTIRKNAQKDNLAGGITILPGFVGSESLQHLERLVTLERGSSDATATYWGAALDLDEIIIYSDKPGILPIDPKIVSGIDPLRELTYREAVVFAGLGASIIQQVAIRPASERKISLWIKSSMMPDLPGTRIGGEPSVDNYGVKAIACDSGLTFLYVHDIPERSGAALAVRSIFANNDVNIIHEVDGDDFRAFAIRPDEGYNVLFDDLHKAGYRTSTMAPIDRVALVGDGMDMAERLSDGLIARDILSRTLRENRIRPLASVELYGACSKSVYVERKHTGFLLEKLARNFGFLKS